MRIKVYYYILNTILLNVKYDYIANTLYIKLLEYDTLHLIYSYLL